MKSTNFGTTLLALALPFVAGAGTTVDIEVLDRKTGRILPVYWHDGDRHVAGEPGREYEIRLRNRGECRVLAVTSVDGVNVITGRTASPAQSGYVLDPWGLVEIDGWRKSMDEVAAFYFTALPDSYAARTGRPDNVGVIGVALFRERARPMPMDDYLARAESAPPAAGVSAEAKASSRQSSARDAEEARLGTGHGRRVDSGAAYTDFERASAEPDEVIRIYYDSRRNLVARGIIPSPGHFAGRLAEPFPSAFVPDP
jgi:hypothetical protein